MNMMSIIPLLLAVGTGVVCGRHISYYDDDAAFQPILSRSQERRICTELCMSGLGGEPCGDECLDLTPQGLPVQSSIDGQTQQNSSDVGGSTGSSARRDVCPQLCENRLGYPLCNCDGIEVKARSDFEVNFSQVCSIFCEIYDYRLYGCQDCSSFKLRGARGDFKLSGSKQRVDWTKVDWNAWCAKKCHIGEGGAACNCDLLPMSF